MAADTRPSVLSKPPALTPHPGGIITCQTSLNMLKKTKIRPFTSVTHGKQNKHRAGTVRTVPQEPHTSAADGASRSPACADGVFFRKTQKRRNFEFVKLTCTADGHKAKNKKMNVTLVTGIVGSTAGFNTNGWRFWAGPASGTDRQPGWSPPHPGQALHSAQVDGLAWKGHRGTEWGRRLPASNSDITVVL